MFKIILEACLFTSYSYRTQLSFSRRELCIENSFRMDFVSCTVYRCTKQQQPRGNSLCHHKWYHYGAILRLDVCIILPCLWEGPPSFHPPKMGRITENIRAEKATWLCFMQNFCWWWCTKLFPSASPFHSQLPQRHFNFSEKFFNILIFQWKHIQIYVESTAAVAGCCSLEVIPNFISSSSLCTFFE